MLVRKYIYLDVLIVNISIDYRVNHSKQIYLYFIIVDYVTVPFGTFVDIKFLYISVVQSCTLAETS